MRPEFARNPGAERAVTWLVWSAFVLFCFFKLLALHDRPMDYDSGYFGTVARNVLDGYGYATSHSERILFNPEITTGPAVIYPLALLISVFGNQAVLPQLFITSGNLSLLALFTVLFHRAYGATRRTAAFLLSVYLFGSFYEPGWWHVCVGDLQVILIMLNIMLLIGVPALQRRPWQAVLLGALLAMGVLVKFSILMALPALLVGLLVQSVHGKLPRFHWPLALGVFLLLLLPFFVYKQLALQQIPAVEREQMQANALSAGASRQAAGIGMFLAADDKLRHVKKSFHRSNAVLTKLFASYGIPPVILYAVLLLPLLTTGGYLLTVWQKGVSFPVLLAWVAGSFTVWHFTMSLAFQTKYTLQLVWFSFLLFFYFAASHRRLFWLPVMLTAMLPLLMSAAVRSDIASNYFQNDDRRAYRQETLAVAGYLNGHPARPALAYCGWGAVPRAVFYLLPAAETTPDCYGAIAARLSADHETAVWRSPVSYWLVRDKLLLSFYPDDVARFERIVAFCEPVPLFDSRFYDIHDCPAARLQEVLAQPALLRQIREYDDPLF